MRIAAKILALAVGAAALAGCYKAQPQQNQDITIDEHVPSSEVPANADIETLPPDESSVTSNGELVKGDDNPDFNDIGNSH